MSGPSLPLPKRSTRPNRLGQSLVLVGVMLAALLGVMALAIDVGMLLQVRAHLQGMADASALAAAQELPSEANAKAQAQEYATQNDSDHGTIVAADEVVVGNWDGLGNFSPGGVPTNAVRVVARRTGARNNAVALFFAKALGITETNVSAWATATSGGGGGPETRTRFLVDEELFKDEPVKTRLKRLAEDSMGICEECILMDNTTSTTWNTEAGDWFVDIPPGTILELPTGQTGDEGLFDINHEAFPFHEGSDPTFQDFLNYNEDSNSWRYNLLQTSDLDPLLGVKRVSHNHLYEEFVDPGYCQVSPVYKSDVSNLNDVDGVPAVNAKGWRRGLLAFSIDSIGIDPDGDASEGGGSRLPHIWIKVCDPDPYTSPGGVVTFPNEADLPLRLVQ